MAAKKGAITQMHTTVINRSQSFRSGNAGVVPGSFSRNSSLRRSIGSYPFAEGAVKSLSHSTVEDVVGTKEKEKQELQSLNSRFASYIEQVRFLQAQNKVLLAENEKLKGQKGFDFSSIKESYQQELESCKQVIEDLSNEKSTFDAKIVGLEELLDTEKRERDLAEKSLAEQKKLVSTLNEQAGQYEGEIAMLRKQLQYYDQETSSLKAKIQRLEEDCQRLRTDLEEETVRRLELENAKQNIWEEYQFHLSICDAEIAELKALLDRDKQVEIANIWKGELSKAILEIQEEYDRQLTIIRADYQSKMEYQLQQLEAGVVKDNSLLANAKQEVTVLKTKMEGMARQLSDMKTENTKFKTQLQLAIEERDDLRIQYENDSRKWTMDIEAGNARFEAIMKEIRILEDAKLSLEMEIAIYRKLLDAEETKFKDIQQTQTIESTGEPMLKMQSTVADTSNRKLLIKKATHGPVNIAEVSPDGRYVSLKNESEKEKNVKGWRLVRINSNGEQLEFTLPDVVIHPDGIYTIYGSCFTGDLEQNEVKAEFLSWGVGNGEYKLFETENFDKPQSSVEIDFDA